MDTIRCPSCLKECDADKLAENTEYCCWSGPEVSVYCLHCEFQFDVSCEHAGYLPDEDFNVRAFMRAHDIKVPDEISMAFVTNYLSNLVEGYAVEPHKSKEYPEHDKQWEAAYHFAVKEWTRVKNKIADYGDAE